MLSSTCNCVLFIGYLTTAHLSLSAAEIGNEPIQDLAADAALKRIVEIEDKLVAIIENNDGIVPLGEAVNFDRDPRVTERLKREEKILAYKVQAVELLGRIGSNRAIKVLIANIDSYFASALESFGRMHRDGGREDSTPAALALQRIGSKAVLPLVEMLERNPNAKQPSQILYDMKDSREWVEAILGWRALAAKSKEVREKLSNLRLQVTGLILEESHKK